jgi:hypothetical protein
MATAGVERVAEDGDACGRGRGCSVAREPRGASARVLRVAPPLVRRRRRVGELGLRAAPAGDDVEADDEPDGTAEGAHAIRRATDAPRAVLDAGEPMRHLGRGGASWPEERARMINDNLGNRRGEWTFAYKAKDLLPYAERKLAHHKAEEASLRQRLAEMIRDPASFHDDVGLQQLKRDVDRHAGLREQFEVYCHEFARTPGNEFRLGLADVVYFGMLEGPPAAE